MTDTIPFAPPQAADDSSGPDRKKLIAGGVAGALVLAAGGYYFLGRGSSEPTYAPVAVHHVPHTVVPGARAVTPAKPAAKPATVALPATSTAVLGRDPFKALVTPPVAVAAPASVDKPSGSATGTTGMPTRSGAGATTTNSGTGTSTTSAAPTTYSLKLISVTGTGGAQTATYTVNGKRQTASVGTVFGPTQEIKLLSFRDSGKTTVIQVGDSEPKNAPLGATVYVR